MGKKLYVGNLSYDTTAAQLETLFSQQGTVVESTVITDRDTGRSKGFGFVEMTEESAVATAIQQLNDTQLDGRSIKVAEAKPRRPREDRGYGGGYGGGSRW